MINFDEIVYLPLNVEVSCQEITTMAEELWNLPTFRSHYRTCEMTPILTPGGQTEKEAIVQSKQVLQWTPYAKSCPNLVEFLERKILNFMTPLPRIVVLKTEAGGEVKVHIDCSQETAQIRQHKLRLVVSGDRAGLWFLHESGKKVHVSGENPIYIIDGAHPHGMINNSNQPKITVCLGAPWRGHSGEAYFSLLKNSLSTFQNQLITRSDLGIVDTKVCFQKEFEKELSTNGDLRSSARNMKSLRLDK